MTSGENRRYPYLQQSDKAEDDDDVKELEERLANEDDRKELEQVANKMQSMFKRKKSVKAAEPKVEEPTPEPSIHEEKAVDESAPVDPRMDPPATAEQDEDIQELEERFKNEDDREELEQVASKMQSLFKKRQKPSEPQTDPAEDPAEVKEPEEVPHAEVQPEPEPEPQQSEAPASGQDAEDVKELEERFNNEEDRKELEQVANKMQSLFKRKHTKTKVEEEAPKEAAEETPKEVPEEEEQSGKVDKPPAAEQANELATAEEAWTAADPTDDEDVKELEARLENEDDRKELEQVANKMQSMFKRKKSVKVAAEPQKPQEEQTQPKQEGHPAPVVEAETKAHQDHVEGVPETPPGPEGDQADEPTEGATSKQEDVIFSKASEATNTSNAVEGSKAGSGKSHHLLDSVVVPDSTNSGNQPSVFMRCFMICNPVRKEAADAQ